MENIKVSELIAKIQEYSRVNPRDKTPTRLTIQGIYLENVLFDLQFELGDHPRFQAAMRDMLEKIERLTQRKRSECEGDEPMRAYN
jgi:hypothetical protein